MSDLRERVAREITCLYAEALEEAARVADDKMAELVSNLQNSCPYNMNSYAAHSHSIYVAKDIAAAIRNLKDGK